MLYIIGIILGAFVTFLIFLPTLLGLLFIFSPIIAIFIAVLLSAIESDQRADTDL